MAGSRFAAVMTNFFNYLKATESICGLGAAELAFNVKSQVSHFVEVFVWAATCFSTEDNHATFKSAVA